MHGWCSSFLDGTFNIVMRPNDDFWNNIGIYSLSSPCMYKTCAKQPFNLAPTIFFSFCFLSSLIFMSNLLIFQNNFLICFSFKFDHCYFDYYFFNFIILQFFHLSYFIRILLIVYFYYFDYYFFNFIILQFFHLSYFIRILLIVYFYYFDYYFFNFIILQFFSSIIFYPHSFNCLFSSLSWFILFFNLIPHYFFSFNFYTRFDSHSNDCYLFVF